MKRSGVAIAFSVAASLAATAASAQATLNNVKQKGFLVCGSNTALPGFGIPDAQGNWTMRIVKHMGNYGEIFERTIGEGSPLKIKRGLNALWTKGGLQYGIPIR